MARYSVWKIIMSITISMGLHGLLLAWVDLNIADETSSTGSKQQPIEVTIVTDSSQRLPSHTKTDPLLAAESMTEEVATHPPLPKILPMSEKSVKPIKRKAPRQKEAKQIHAYHAAAVEPTNSSDLLAENREPQSLLTITSPSIAKISAPAAETKYSKRAKENYLAGLRAAISRYKYYPARARRMRKQGNVWVEFFIYRDGHIDQVVIRESSGEPMLDRAARQSVLKLGRYQPFPKRIDASFLSVAVPMSYTTY